VKSSSGNKPGGKSDNVQALVRASKVVKSAPNRKPVGETGDIAKGMEDDEQGVEEEDEDEKDEDDDQEEGGDHIMEAAQEGNTDGGGAAHLSQHAVHGEFQKYGDRVSFCSFMFLLYQHDVAA
jgi:hypothetical protein